jgi:hypothetical protein
MHGLTNDITDGFDLVFRKKQLDPIWANYLVARDKDDVIRIKIFRQNASLIFLIESQFDVSDERGRRIACVHTVHLATSLGSKGPASDYYIVPVLINNSFGRALIDYTVKQSIRWPAGRLIKNQWRAKDGLKLASS